jgi:hypothetical protein
VKRLTLAFVFSGILLGTGTVAMAQDVTPVAPDNSAVNARDHDAGAITAGQQSNAPSDVELTRKIRRAVVTDHSLSMMAHNVKIVSANGSVILRDERERAKEIFVKGGAEDISYTGEASVSKEQTTSDRR